MAIETPTSTDTPSSYEDLAAGYLAQLASEDPAARAVAQHQLARLRRRRATAVQDGATTTATTGVLARLVEQAVGTLDKRSSGALEGACPWHSSRSGRCLVVLADGRRWWCRSCRRGGDVVAWVALTRGVSFAEARRRLGLPVQVRAPRPRVEVVRYAR